MSGFLVGKDEEVTSEGWIKNTEHYCAFLCCTFFLGETFDFSAMYQNKVQVQSAKYTLSTLSGSIQSLRDKSVGGQLIPGIQFAIICSIFLKRTTGDKSLKLMFVSF